MILFVLFRLLSPTTLQLTRREVLRLRSIAAESRKYQLLGRTGIISSLDRQN